MCCLKLFYSPCLFQAAKTSFLSRRMQRDSEATGGQHSATDFLDSSVLESLSASNDSFWLIIKRM